MTEGRIENAPFAVHFVPSYGEIVVRPVDTRVVHVVESCGIETEQNVDLFA